ncbi:MAG: hypothetical protein FWE82_02030 [Defluviitaleaceae bacterium]|nr:hypothetical protein [Defluviitaleaceae bacterium]
MPPQNDIKILRDLAKRVAEIAAKPSEKKKAMLWTAHNDLKTDIPLVMFDPDWSAWQELVPWESCSCETNEARSWELDFRKTIWRNEVLKDDKVADNFFYVPYDYSMTGWGIDPKKNFSGTKGGAYKIRSVLEDYEKDFCKLRFPQITVDYKKSSERLEEAQNIFDGILNVEQRSEWWWTLGLTWTLIDLRGFDEFLCDFILEPEWLKKLLDFLYREADGRLTFLEKNGLLSQNTGNHYVGSGGCGYTDEIPQKAPGEPVTAKDMWGFVESQETVSVDPEMYGEFIFPYHKKLMERFSLSCFACCEPYEPRWKYAKQLHGLRRVSCSPWSNRGVMEELLGKNYVASIKPAPSSIAYAQFKDDLVRGEIREALECSKNCIPELIMKDVHTVGGNPHNAVRWVEICREEIMRLYG